jgi:hypothetical protein
MSGFSGHDQFALLKIRDAQQATEQDKSREAGTLPTDHAEESYSEGTQSNRSSTGSASSSPTVSSSSPVTFMYAAAVEDTTISQDKANKAAVDVN